MTKRSDQQSLEDGWQIDGIFVVHTHYLKLHTPYMPI